MFVLCGFGLYTLFSVWVVLLKGAEVIDGWRSSPWFARPAAGLTPGELRAYVGLAWLGGLVLLLVLWSWERIG